MGVDTSNLLIANSGNDLPVRNGKFSVFPSDPLDSNAECRLF